MQQITGREAVLAVLHDPSFVVPAVPAATGGVAWLRATVGRFSTGPDHERRRALAVAVIDAVDPDAVRRAAGADPVTVLARAIGVSHPVAELVREVAQAYQPGTGDEPRADAAVERLVTILGGAHDEPVAARIGVLVQACAATTALIERARHRPVEEVLRDDPPVPATRRQALTATTVGGVPVRAGEVVLVSLAGGPAFGAGPRRCPGRDLALALAARRTDVPRVSPIR